MCALVGDRQQIDSLPASRKHPRDDAPPGPPDLPSEPLLKRPCAHLDAPDIAASVGFLDELYEFENTLDASAIEAVTQEDLLTEMMRSLEKVIGSIDESGLPEPRVSEDSPQPVDSRQTGASDVENWPSTAPSEFSDEGLESDLLVDSSLCGVSPAEETTEALSEDWPELDVHCSEFESGFSTPISGAAQRTWLDGNFDYVEMAFPEFSQDYCYQISLDSVF